MKEYIKMKDKFDDVALELAVKGPKVQEIAAEVEQKVTAMSEVIKQAKKLQLQSEAALKKDSPASASHIYPNRLWSESLEQSYVCLHPERISLRLSISGF